MKAVMQMRTALVACWLIAGCAESPARHGNAALGVSDFAVRETASELDIVGIDPRGTTLAHLHVRTGMVTPAEWQVQTAGRELRFEIMGVEYPPFVSAGLAPLSLPLTGDPYLNTLVRDPFVAPILSGRGIEFVDHTRVGAPEVEYGQCSANTVLYFAPCNGYGQLSTCYDFWGYFGGNQIWAQKVVCNDPAQTRADRMCAYAGAMTPCGTAGPNGCAVCGPGAPSGWPGCVNDSCTWSSAGGGGGGGAGDCHGTVCSLVCNTDDDCCSCGGYCDVDGTCAY
jgi:hypothetical protein